MISSRRLAREWALKILYQMDVGKVELEEAREAAMERLRLEFIQRGSRTASGSQAEQICLDSITASLRDTLPTLRAPFERAVTHALGSLFAAAPYWQEVRFEKAFKTRFPGITLSPPRLLLPPSPPALTAEGETLTDAERKRFHTFVRQAEEELPRLLETELRKTARAFVKQLADDRPPGATSSALQDYLLERRRAFNTETLLYWQKVGQMVQKQTADWMRVSSFTIRLLEGLKTYHTEIDHVLTALASGWKLERQVAVDRNILRMAAFEILHLPSIPTSASINEAVELAKKYSTAESGRFVNGVLGALATQVGEKPAPAGNTEDEEALDATILDLPDITDLEEPVEAEKP